jgi:hypothetical protein
MGPPPGYGLQPIGHHFDENEPGQYRALPYGYQSGALPPSVCPPPSPQYTFEQLPDDCGFAEGDTPLGKLLTETFRHAWFRGEYIQWTISKPGPALLGDQPADGVANNVAGIPGSGSATNGFNPGGPANVPISNGVEFVRSVNGIPGLAQSPTLDNNTIQNSNGYRGTFGLPVWAGSLEVSAFVLAQNNTNFDGNNWIQPQILANPAVTPGNILGQTGPKLGQNGLPATNFQPAQFFSQALLTNFVRTPFATTAFLDYDLNYNARLSTSAWGTEGNYIMDSVNPNAPFQFRPTFGFRYFNYRDRLDQTGQYSQPSALDPTVTTVVTRQIGSAATNNLFGPQMGVRAEYSWSRFLVGVEPKLMLGLNSYQINLNTANILSSTDPSQTLLARSTTFSPMVDLRGYGNIALSKNVSAYISYNFLWAGNVTRSFNDVIYNTNTITNTSDFAIKKELTNVSLQGMSFGFDIKY